MQKLSVSETLLIFIGIVGKTIKIIADKGYQGIAKIHQLSETPIKKRTACAEVSSA